MNQDQVKELLLQIEETELEFSVTFTGKASKKVNGLYKSDTHEILLHNKNFSADNELLYTAIHEYTHHRLFELDGTRSGRVHTQRFWSYFHQLLQKAEEKKIYTIDLAESPELLELTETIRTTIMTEDGKLMKELGRLLGQARKLCKQAGVRYEDYIDRVLCLPRTSASTIEKMHAFDIKPELGYEAMKVVANIPNPEKRNAAESLFLQQKSPAFVRESIKAKKQDEDPRRKLENEKHRIERTIASLQARLNELETTLSKLPVTVCVFCIAAFLYAIFAAFPLTADADRAQSSVQLHVPDIPAIPPIPAITVNGTMQRPQPPAIQQPRFQTMTAPTAPQISAQRNTAGGSTKGSTRSGSSGTAASGTGSSAGHTAQPSKLLNGLNAQTLAALTQNNGAMTQLNSVLNTMFGSSTGSLGGLNLGTDTGLDAAVLPTGIPAVGYTSIDRALLNRLLSEVEKLQAQTATAGTKQSEANAASQSGSAAQSSTAEPNSNTAAAQP